MKNYATMIATAFLGGAMTLGGYKLFIDKFSLKFNRLLMPLDWWNDYIGKHLSDE